MLIVPVKKMTNLTNLTLNQSTKMTLGYTYMYTCTWRLGPNVREKVTFPFSACNTLSAENLRHPSVGYFFSLPRTGD